MSIALLVILGLFFVAVIVVAVAKVGPDAFVALWNRLPVRLRSVVNVAIAAALAFGGGALIDWVSSSDLPVWVQVAATAVLTPIVRTLNSADDYPTKPAVTTGSTGANGTQDG